MVVTIALVTGIVVLIALLVVRGETGKLCHRLVAVSALWAVQWRVLLFSQCRNIRHILCRHAEGAPTSYRRSARVLGVAVSFLARTLRRSTTKGRLQCGQPIIVVVTELLMSKRVVVIGVLRIEIVVDIADKFDSQRRTVSYQPAQTVRTKARTEDIYANTCLKMPPLRLDPTRLHVSSVERLVKFQGTEAT